MNQSMNHGVDMKKQLLKEALSKTKNGKQQSLPKQVRPAPNQNNSLSRISRLQLSESIEITPKSIIPSRFAKKSQFKQSIVGNILVELQTSHSKCTVNRSRVQSVQSSNFTQKPSCRSAFSDSLYTQQTDNVKEMIHKLFQRRKFTQQLDQEINSYILTDKKKLNFQEMKNKLLHNQIFVLSLQARTKEIDQKQKQKIIQKEVKKKVINHFEFTQNQKLCHAAQMRIQKFLQQKLRKLRRKQL